MEKCQKQILLIISSLILLICPYKLSEIVKADSDLGLNSNSKVVIVSNNSDNYYSYENYTTVDYLSTIIPLIMIIIIFLTLIILKAKKNMYINPNKITKSSDYIDMDEKLIKDIDKSIDKEKLKQELFIIYKKVQEAWMNLDYNTLRNNLTDELYSMYNSQLKILKAQNQQTIIKEIKYINSKIIEVKIENNIENVKIYLNVEQYDYIINKSNKVVRGTDKYKNNVEYIITYIKNIKETKVNTCPNCGANIKIASGGTCPYCDSHIVTSSNQFVMSKKECINQRRIS